MPAHEREMVGPTPFRKRRTRSPSVARYYNRPNSNWRSNSANSTARSEASNPQLPSYAGSNIIDWHIYNRLRRLWEDDSHSWSLEERRHFAAWARWATVTVSDHTIERHKISIFLLRNRPSWGHFVILRAMFGAYACSTQNWWDDFKARYPKATEDAPLGVVPKDVLDVLEKNSMDSPPITPIPTMEDRRRMTRQNDDLVEASSLSQATQDVNQEAESSIRNTSEVRQANIAAPLQPDQDADVHASTPVVVDIEDNPSVQTIDESPQEDLERFQREQGVEPNVQEVEETDPEWSEFLANASKLTSKRSSTSDNQVKKMREHMKQQTELLGQLVTLVKNQEEKINALEAKVESVTKAQTQARQ